MPPLPPWAHEAVVAPLAAALALHQAARALGLARALVELGALAAYGYALERVAIAVFRSHVYGDAWALAPGGVPVAVAVVWAAVLSSAMAVAGRRGRAGPLDRAATAALVGITLDLLMEPVAVRRGLWHWTPPGAWLGVPVGNFVGWGVIVGVYTYGAERWGGASALRREALHRLGLAVAAVAALVAVGLVWRGLALEDRFGARTGWATWGALLLATAARATARAGTDAGAGTLATRLARTSGRGPAAVFLFLAAAFAWDAAALGGHAVGLVALGTVVTLAWATRPPETAVLFSRARLAALSRFARAEGLVRVLMKPRNGTPWTAADRQFLRSGLLALARLSPAFLLFLLPGGMLLLAGYACVLDRRRGGRPPETSPRPVT